MDPSRKGRSNAYAVGGEQRTAIIGATRAGRILVVVYTMRDGHIRPITGWPASIRDQRTYRGESS